jgi:acyl-CoA thioesterase-2
MPLQEHASEEDVTHPVGVDDLVMALTPVAIGEDRYTLPGTDWWRGDRVFGGMVVAQALRAAQASVPDELPVHSLHGYFLRPVPVGAPVELSVERIRDGRSFTTRRVTSSVDGRDTFMLTCSFHAPEDGDEYQMTMPRVPPPESVPSTDVPIPFDVRELGSTPRRADGTFLATRRVWFRTREPLTGPADTAPMHAAIVAYLSDMTGAAFRPYSLGTWGGYTDASLDHALWCHRPCRTDEWLLYDLQCVVNTGGRSTIRGALYSQDGALCASMSQELLIREVEGAETEVHPSWADGPAPALGPATSSSAPVPDRPVQSTGAMEPSATGWRGGDEVGDHPGQLLALVLRQEVPAARDGHVVEPLGARYVVLKDLVPAP